MRDVAIRIEGLSKRYRLGEREQYKTLRDSLAGLVRRPRSAGGRRGASARPFIWALKDLTVDVRQGEVIGVIGRNGAGKTTLLKVLSRITAPTSGMAVVRGRVGALLEVGTGFHPELTGRENIYLSGAILGMRKSEIERKFEEIVAFAGVEPFMDTPVKHYSSGMYVRLAFAVAAHLEPEILVVDEVLAVGDMEFQKKCLGKLQGVARQGRTVLFVSHNLAAMAQLCDRGLLLDQGQLVTSGPMPEVIDAYLRSGANRQAEVRFPEDASKTVQVTSLQITDALGEPSLDLDRGKPVQVVAEVLAHEAARATLLFQLSTAQGVRICQSVCADALRRYSVFGPRDRRQFVVQLPSEVLNEGTYRATVYVIPSNTAPYDAVESPLFSLHDVESRDAFLGERKRDISVLRLPLEWIEQDAGQARPSRAAPAGTAA